MLQFHVGLLVIALSSPSVDRQCDA